MFRRIAWLLGLVGVLGGLGCGKADLSRGNAETLISQSAEFQNLRKALVFHDDGYRKGIQQGMWEDEFRRGWHVGVLTDKGKRYFSEIAQIPMTNKRAGTAVAEVKTPAVQVTGISKEGETGRVAEFSFTYVDLPPVVKRFVVAGGSGKATFKLYDDGWRLDHLELSLSDQPAALTNQDKAEEQADVAAAAKEAQEAAEKKRAEAAAQAKRVEESKIPTKTIGSFTNFATDAEMRPGAKPGLGTVVVTDASIDFTNGGRHCTAWFGKILEITPNRTLDSIHGVWYDQALISPREKAWFGQGGLGCDADRMLSFPSAAERDRFIEVANRALRDWRSKYPWL